MFGTLLGLTIGGLFQAIAAPVFSAGFALRFNDRSTGAGLPRPGFADFAIVSAAALSVVGPADARCTVAAAGLLATAVLVEAVRFRRWHLARRVVA